MDQGGSEEGTAPTICRFCCAGCGILVSVEDGRSLRVRGDVSNPATEGFTCVKGRALPEQHNAPDRVLGSYRRSGSAWVRRPSAEVLDEVARRRQGILDERGPRSLALYSGTGVCY